MQWVIPRQFRELQTGMALAHAGGGVALLGLSALMIMPFAPALQAHKTLAQIWEALTLAQSICAAVALACGFLSLCAWGGAWAYVSEWKRFAHRLKVARLAPRSPSLVRAEDLLALLPKEDRWNYPALCLRVVHEQLKTEGFPHTARAVRLDCVATHGALHVVLNHGDQFLCDNGARDLEFPDLPLPVSLVMLPMDLNQLGWSPQSNAVTERLHTELQAQLLAHFTQECEGHTRLRRL